MDNITQNNSVVPIISVHLNDYNPKPDYMSSDELRKVYEGIVSSIKYNGQIDPLIVREVNKGFEIINGAHRYHAMTELGYSTVEIKNLGKISRAEAIKKAITTEILKIQIDQIEEAKLLKEIGGDIIGLPYSVEEINEKISVLDFDPSEFDQVEENQSNEGKEKDIECPECGHRFEI